MPRSTITVTREAYEQLQQRLAWLECDQQRLRERIELLVLERDQARRERNRAQRERDQALGRYRGEVPRA
jgi:septal ring factor EnvC (AmiA/AmiB activator)